MKILVTGCAGFIGYHLIVKLNNLGHKVYGVDNLNSYYDVNLKKDRIKDLKKNKLFHFEKLDILKEKKLEKIFKKKNWYCY